MAAQCDVKAAEAKTTGTAQPTLEPTNGGLNVHIAGGVGLVASDAVGAPDATLPSNVVVTGGGAKATAPTAVTTGRTVRQWLSLVGSGFQTLTNAAGDVLAKVIAGSSAAAYTDPALVVEVRPGGSFPALVGGGVPVVDASVSIVAAADVNCTTAQKVTAQTGAGYLTITNRDASATIYVGGSGVTGSTNGMAIPPGQRDTAYYTNLALVYAIGSTTVNGCVRR